MLSMYTKFQSDGRGQRAGSVNILGRPTSVIIDHCSFKNHTNQLKLMRFLLLTSEIKVRDLKNKDITTTTVMKRIVKI